MVSLEQLLDRIAEKLILDETGIVTPAIVNQNQKTIRNGSIQLGRAADETDILVLYQKDVEANEKDLLFIPSEGSELQTLQSIANQITDLNLVGIYIQQIEGTYTINLSGGGIAGEADISFIVDLENNNPLNVSQFVPLKQKKSIIDVDTANEFLDTNIFELLPTGDTRQSRIVRFFQELNALLPPNEPQLIEQ